ncbi:MAG: hypothetical protein ABJD07_04045 [Gemmatimonadaceae bacterium]
MRLISLIASGPLVVATLACASKPVAQNPAEPPPPQEAPRQPSRPLAGFAAQKILVMPARYLRVNDAVGWNDQIGASAEFLKRVDDELTFALRERGVQGSWVLPADVVKSAKRNATYVADPYALGEEALRPPRKVPDLIPDPLATQLRGLVALHEGARYALLPVEVRFEKIGTSQARAVLHLVVIDTRMVQARWSGEVASDPALVYSNAVAASLAARVADLISAP